MALFPPAEWGYIVLASKTYCFVSGNHRSAITGSQHMEVINADVNRHNASSTFPCMACRHSNAAGIYWCYTNFSDKGGVHAFHGYLG